MKKFLLLKVSVTPFCLAFNFLGCPSPCPVPLLILKIEVIILEKKVNIARILCCFLNILLWKCSIITCLSNAGIERNRNLYFYR